MSVALDNGVIEGTFLLSSSELLWAIYPLFYLARWKRIAAAIITNGDTTDVINSVRHF